VRFKVLLISFLTIASSIFSAPVSRAVVDLNSGLVVYWNFENGTDVGYSAVGGISLSPYGTPAYTSAGGGHNGGRGLLLDGSSWLSTNNPITNLPLGAHPYTLSAWVNPSGGSAVGGIIAYGTASAQNLGNNLRFNGMTAIWHYWYANDFGMEIYPDTFLNSWHHITSTWDGTVRSLYCDGILKSSDTPTSQPNFTAGSLVIGRTLNDANLTGTLDDIAIYDRALSQSEITALASTGISAVVTPPTISSAAITGNTRVGQTLTAGTIGASGTISTTTYQWQRSEKFGTGYSNIPAAISQSYLLVPKDSEKYLRVIVTIGNTSGTVSATSTPTVRIAEAAKDESKGDKKPQKDEDDKKSVVLSR
jgi:Concanavalin A-like lectin/glucanases superfamily